MDTVPQDAFATLGLAEEGGEGLTGLARALLEAGVNEMMAAQAVTYNFLRTLTAA